MLVGPLEVVSAAWCFLLGFLALLVVGGGGGGVGTRSSCLPSCFLLVLRGLLGLGTLPPPTVRPQGVRPGPVALFSSGAGGAGAMARHQRHSARSCEVALRALGAAGGRPGGASPVSVTAVQGFGTLPPPTARPWSGGRGPLHFFASHGGGGIGAPQKTLALCVVAAVGGHLAGGASCLQEGCSCHMLVLGCI